MTTTTETTTTDKTTVISVVRSEHYAARTMLAGIIRYLVCACGMTFLGDRTGEAGFRHHMVEHLGHRPQAVEIDRETGAMTIVCTCGDQPPMVTDGSAWDLHRAHVEFPHVKPLVPAQVKPAPEQESFPYSATLPAWALGALKTVFGSRPELIIHRDGICYFSRQAIDVLRSSHAMERLGSKIIDYPAGAELVIFAPQSFGPVGRFALTYRLV